MHMAISQTKLLSVAIIFFLGLILFQVIVYAMRYKRCPADKVLVIYGRVGPGRTAMCLHGGGKFIWPLLQDYAYLDLDPLTVTLPFEEVTRGKSTSPASLKVMVGISTEPEVMNNAVTRLLGLKREKIESMAKAIVLGRLRSEVESFGAEQIGSEMDGFLVKARKGLDEELRKIGMFTVNVVDTGYAG